MINTYFGQGALETGGAFFMALMIGVSFGFCLERAGFGSSRRLAGIFYFRDMAVLKVMFTALITAMLGIFIVVAMGWLDPREQLFLMKTYYGSHLVAGLLFGVGFVMAGWCPGTAVVGLASGKVDAGVFLVGGILGSILFNELFPFLKSLYQWGESASESLGHKGVSFLYEVLSMNKESFALLFTCTAVGLFWVSEAVEKKFNPPKKYTHRSSNQAPVSRSFLRAFCASLVFVAGSLFLLSMNETHLSSHTRFQVATSGVQLLKKVETAKDHIEPEELADRLSQLEPGLQVVDVRPHHEYRQFHIRGAINVSLPDLPTVLQPYKNRGLIVLYSNGMTHPAQARDILQLMGFRNVYLLTDGLNGFIERCLKPVSLREEPVTEMRGQKIRDWRTYFYGKSDTPVFKETVNIPLAAPLPGLISTQWLADHLHHNTLKVIDCREQPEYNTAHIPGALFISVESFRGVVGGVPSLLVPADMIGRILSLMGIIEDDTVVLVYGGNRFRDASLIGMALLRVGHPSFGILDGGFDRWAAEKRPLSTELPSVSQSAYEATGGRDTFTVAYPFVLKHQQHKSATILDVRPVEYFTGEKTNEARPGHIPEAINRPYKNDLDKDSLLPLETLKKAYADILPDPTRPVIIHCRTGHQASQTFFVLTSLLHYEKVFWYDAGWTEWAARKELPAVMSLP